MKQTYPHKLNLPPKNLNVDRCAFLMESFKTTDLKIEQISHFDQNINKQLYSMDAERNTIIQQFNRIREEILRFTAGIKAIDEELAKWAVWDSVSLSLNQNKRDLFKKVLQKQQQACLRLANFHKLAEDDDTSKSNPCNLNTQIQSRDPNNSHKNQQPNQEQSNVQHQLGEFYCSRQDAGFVSGQMREQLKAIKQLDAILCEKQQQRKIVKTLLEMEVSSLQNSPKKQFSPISSQVEA